ncbi:toxic anion resistance protein [Caldibacillus thermoamylovorans]|nr:MULTISPECIES: toxic anion resistance protein [Bacillaceae]MCB5935723.1 toxic anion resistance protein [Bacillus sp. DFI.2.34]MCB7076743.1 toxic anion resistance protein [Caldibacillus thermoamylovorans]MCM3798876.1 toxic anion resistance protein [Caldibacillus thermoamylovorans]MDL0420604.1 toxic anion resistance protein [Caldibacillus thermoamylovorans]MED3643884.1 toxic anion resistance protein [Caldifermentibacillus hisashii]
MVEKEKLTGDIDDLLANPFGDLSKESAENKQELQEAGKQMGMDLFNKVGETKPKKLIETLPDEDKQRAYQLANQIDPKNQTSISLYGTQAQSKLMNFSSTMLDHVKSGNIGEIGEIITDLMKKLDQVNPDELQVEKRNIFSRMFGKMSRSVNEILARYQKTGAQIDRITVRLEHCKNTLIKDNTLLDQMYEKNKEYFQALNIYIAAGEVKLEELHTKLIPELKRKAEQSGDQMAYQEVNDMIQFADRLEKRLHDLKLSRQITIQSAPQIRMIQNTNQTLMEKIQTSITTAIPLWKNQIAIALTLLRQQKAVEAQKQVSQTTNDLLLKNSEMLKTNSIEVAKENERGIVDIETLKKTQENLVSTLEETLRIQAEGRAKRHQAEQELVTMEEQLKQKLLEIRGN